MTECSKCGDCCRVIPFALRKRELALRRVLPKSDSDDVPFLLKHWHRIRKAEAHRRNPLVPMGKGRIYYECDMFDSETNECTAHDIRPEVCKGFPWYGREPVFQPVSTFPICSFWADLPIEQHPPYVQLGETRRAS